MIPLELGSALQLTMQHLQPLMETVMAPLLMAPLMEPLMEGQQVMGKEEEMGKEKENHSCAMLGTTTMGLVLASLQDQVAKEAFQENTSAQVVEVLDILPINAQRKPPDHLPEEGLATRG